MARDKKVRTKYDEAIDQLKRNTLKKVNDNDFSIFDVIMQWKFKEDAIPKIIKKKTAPEKSSNQPDLFTFMGVPHTKVQKAPKKKRAVEV